MTVKSELEGVWCEFISDIINYPCVLQRIENTEGLGFPIAKVSVDEVNLNSEGVIPVKTVKDLDTLEVNYKYNSEYILTLNFYFKSDKEFNVDDLVLKMSNYKVFNNEIDKYIKNSETFKKIALRGNLEVVNTNEFLESQTVSRIRYQQNFLVEISRSYEIPRAKKEVLKEVLNEIN